MICMTNLPKDLEFEFHLQVIHLLTFVIIVVLSFFLFSFLIWVWIGDDSIAGICLHTVAVIDLILIMQL